MAAPIETFVAAPGPLVLLKGTLLAPADNPHAPVVLIVPGSGPTDRDGDDPLGVKAAPYRLLAEALAVDDIASARIDKRGMFASAPAVKSPDQVTIGDYASDVHAWIASLKATTGAPCIWVLGHSEGALVAEAAAQRPEGICGIILVSGMGRRFGDVIAEQLKDNPANAPILPEALAALAKLEAGQHVDAASMNPALLPLFRPSVQDYLVDLMAQDPVKLLAAYAGPVLVMQGTTDLQVSVEDAQMLAHARPGVELVLLQGVNHVLKVAPADRTANIATYADPSLPLAPGVADAVAAFVKAHAAP
ncbi:MAG TPA: alpha/beta fold hydrolase [Caulobacteraceae bacterium]|nr:alpha/beta fold hydrolase [Caulobacteraceae bacterium]